jgi:hypothetical protein
MAWVIYDHIKPLMLSSGAINFAAGGDTLKVMLCTSGYVPDQTNHQFKNDVTNEVSGGNYSAGGVTLASKTAIVSAHAFTFDCADLVWLQHATGFTNARIAVFYKSTGVDATSPLIGYTDLGSTQNNVVAALPLGTPAGIFTVLPAPGGYSAWQLYDAFVLRQFTGTPIDFPNETTLKVALLTSAYTLDLAGHTVFSDVQAAEVSGTNYSAGGVTLAGLGVAVSGHVARFGVSPRGDATNPRWAVDPGGFVNAIQAVCYRSTGVAATSPLIAYASLNSVALGNVTGGDCELYFPQGIVQL